jgi:hypothetical protein
MFNRKKVIPKERPSATLGKSLENEARQVLGPPPREISPANRRIPREEIGQLRRIGYSMAQIGEYYKVSRATVYRVWKGE